MHVRHRSFLVVAWATTVVGVTSWASFQDALGVHICSDVIQAGLLTLYLGSVWRQPSSRPSSYARWALLGALVWVAMAGVYYAAGLPRFLLYLRAAVLCGMLFISHRCDDDLQSPS